MKHKAIDKIMLILVALVVCTLAAVNLFQADRPTVSETENRNLAQWPEFSLDAIVDGSYFSDIGKFFSDTFYARDSLVSLSKKLDRLKSLSLFFGEGDFVVIIDPNATAPSWGEETLSTLPPLPTLPPTDPTDLTDSTYPTAPNPTDPTEPSAPNPTDPPVTILDSSVKLDVGAAYVMSAQVADGYGNLVWTIDNDDVLYLTDNGDGTATIKGIAAGEASVSVAVTNEETGAMVSCTCIVTVSSPVVNKPDDVADFLPNGLFIYDGAAYSQSGFVKSNVEGMAQVWDRFATLFPNTRITAMAAPLSSITIFDEAVLSNISREDLTQDKMEALMPDTINYINLKATMMAHADEYIYFRSDHHWTHRGAYYAYEAFMKSTGETPRPLNDFDVRVLTDQYIGSMAGYTGDDRVKQFYDSVEVYLPSKACTMTIYDTQWGNLQQDYCINLNHKNYLAFLNGDYGYIVINVPENPQDKTVLVIKDSFGNAFVPYLTEHYGNIYVIDPRHADINVVEKFADMDLDDIIFMTNVSCANSASWYNYYLKMIS
ncbi:MAG: DHHW family protein [Faecousia sp.]